MTTLNLEKTTEEKTIVLSTNFTKGARNACRFAIQLFGDENVKYVLIHSYYEPPMAHDALHSVKDVESRNAEKDLKSECEKLQSEFPQFDLKIKYDSIFGLLISAINEAVIKYTADFVVIGNKSSFDLESKLLGYKTANFIRKIECPVLAIPENVQFKEMNEITFASDMKSIKNLDVLKPALDLLKNLRAKLNILYVSKEEEILAGQKAEAGIYLDNYFTEVDHEFHHSSNPFIISGISRFVEKTESGLVILLARKHNFFQRLRESSKTQLMSELAKVPILVLHE